jgi:hypothetical protein
MSPPPDSWYALVERQIMDLQASYGELDKALERNTEATLRVEKNTEGVVEMFTAAAGAFRVLETIGKIAKPIAIIVGLFSGLGTLWFRFKDAIINHLSR